MGLYQNMIYVIVGIAEHSINMPGAAMEREHAICALNVAEATSLGKNGRKR